MKIFPAYAKTLRTYIAQGHAPRLVAVVLCADWSIADDLPKVCISPRDWEPDAYEFGYLRRLDVVLMLGNLVGERAAAQCMCEVLEAAPHDLVVTDQARKLFADGGTSVWMAASGWFDTVLVADIVAAGDKAEVIEAARAEYARRKKRLRALLPPVLVPGESLEAWFDRREYLRKALVRQDEPAAA